MISKNYKCGIEGFDGLADSSYHVFGAALTVGRFAMGYTTAAHFRSGIRIFVLHEYYTVRSSEAVGNIRDRI